MSKKKPKKSSNKDEAPRRCFVTSCLCRLLNGVPAALVLLLLIFIWSSCTTIISSSMVHVCVTSRKLNNLYCLSAGSQPTNFDLPLQSISNNSKISVVQRNTKLVQETPLNSPSIASQSTTVLGSEGKTKVFTKSSQNFAISSPIIPSIGPRSVLRENVAIQLPVSTTNETKQLSDGITKEVSLFTNVAIENDIDKEKVEEMVNARKEVERQLAILRTYIAKSKTSDCENRGIYVYELPPKFNNHLLAMCNEMLIGYDFCEYLSNDAMGEAIPELGKGWYNTHEYALEPLFHNRILNHPCRVQNPEDAKLFYVPFYGGFDVLRWHFKEVSNDVKDTLSNELVAWLENKWTWKRNFGLDHVLVLGKISWDFRRSENSSWGSQLLELDELQNPVKLLLERQPWQINDVGIAHPSYFHPSSDEEIIAWQEKIRHLHRNYLISFAGAPREGIRSILIGQCTSSTNCIFLNCAEKACSNPGPVVKLFMDSEFCLHPSGDSATRKSVFDSLIAGCIPVFFDPFTAYYQYPWHLPEDHSKYSVFIDQEDVKMSEVNVVEHLLKISLDQRLEMRKYITDELMPKLVYAQAIAKLEKFQDAFTISVDNLLQRAISKLP